MNNFLSIDEARLLITGKNNGKSVELTGDVEAVEVRTEYDEEEFMSSRYQFSRPNHHYITVKLKEDKNGHSFVIREKPLSPTVVDRTARIEASDRTAESIEMARVLAKAPVDARFTLGGFDKLDALSKVDSPTPIMVEFYWKETV